jgi:hypothetical protein
VESEALAELSDPHTVGMSGAQEFAFWSSSPVILISTPILEILGSSFDSC